MNKSRNAISKSIIFTPKEFGGLGMQSVREYWGAIQCSWLKRTYTPSDFWLELLLEKQAKKNTPIPTLKFRTMSRILNGGNNFWEQVLERWKSILKYIEKTNSDFFLSTNMNLHPKTN